MLPSPHVSKMAGLKFAGYRYVVSSECLVEESSDPILTSIIQKAPGTGCQACLGVSIETFMLHP